MRKMRKFEKTCPNENNDIHTTRSTKTQYVVLLSLNPVFNLRILTELRLLHDNKISVPNGYIPLVQSAVKIYHLK